MEDALIETWQIHNRINLYLLDAVPEEAMSAHLPPKSRSVFDLFAHIHNVRLMWLKASAPELLDGIEKLAAGTAGTKQQSVDALRASGSAIEMLIRSSMASGGRIKGFKPHATAFVGYVISHESHHRGHIEWVLKYSGHPLTDKTSFGLWEWGVR